MLHLLLRKKLKDGKLDNKWKCKKVNVKQDRVVETFLRYY